MEEKINLTSKDILEKDFKFDTRGYRPQEVDKFLDVVIQDYEEFNKKIREQKLEIKELTEDNVRLKQEIRSMKMKLEVIEESSSSGVNNVDLLRRISSLEKIIYGKE